MAEPRLKPHPPEEDEAPVRPAPQAAPPDETITLRVPKWKVLMVLLGFLVGATLAGGVVWWLVYKGRQPRRLQKRNLCHPLELLAEEAASEYFQKGKNAKDVDEKIALFTKAIELNPKPGYYYIQRGRAYLNKKEYNKAIADLDKAVEAIPNSFAAYNLRGLAYDGLDKQAQAMAEFNKAISLNPAYAEAYSNRGAVFYENKEYDKALHDYDKAISLDPNLANAYNNRGFLYAVPRQVGASIRGL